MTSSLKCSQDVSWFSNSTRIYLSNCSLVHSSNSTWLVQSKATKKNLHGPKLLHYTSLTWLNTSANSHILRLQDSNIGPQKGLNVHTYIQVQGITTDTHVLIKDNLQSWGAVDIVVVNSILSQALCSIMDFFFVLLGLLVQIQWWTWSLSMWWSLSIPGLKIYKTIKSVLHKLDQELFIWVYWPFFWLNSSAQTLSSHWK